MFSTLLLWQACTWYIVSTVFLRPSSMFWKTNSWRTNYGTRLGVSVTPFSVYCITVRSMFTFNMYYGKQSPALVILSFGKVYHYWGSTRSPSPHHHPLLKSFCPGDDLPSKTTFLNPDLHSLCPPLDTPWLFSKILWRAIGEIQCHPAWQISMPDMG